MSGVALAHVFLEHAAHDAGDVGRHERIERRHVGRLDREDRAQHGGVGVARERPLAAEQLVRHHARREDVGALVDRLARRLLGRHVGRRAQDRADHRHLGRGLAAAPREPEVHDLDRAVGREHQVRRLDVAMHDAVAVRVLQAAAEIVEHEQRHLERGRAVRRDPLLQVHALDEFHGDVGHVFVPAAVDDLDDVLVPHHRGRARLALEALDELLVLSNTSFQALQHKNYVLLIDVLKGMGGALACPSNNTLERIRKNLSLKQEVHNPLYLLTDASPADYQLAIENCLQDPDVDGVLVICIPFPGINLRKIAEAIVNAATRNPNTPLFTTWGGEKTALNAIDFLNSRGIPTFYTPEQAVKSFMYMYRYDYNLQLLRETPEIILKDFTPDLEKAEQIIRDSLDQKRFALHADEASELLRSFGISALETIRVDGAEEAVRASRHLGYPVVMKIDSVMARNNRRRTQIAVDLKDDQQVRQVFAVQNDLLISLGDPEARVTMQPMVSRSEYKLAVGAKKSMSFGTVILFGLGGEYLKAEKDYSIGLPPLNQTLARRMMEETKIYHYLHEMPSHQGALGYLEEMLVRFSQLLIALPQIGEININPLLLMGSECVVRDVAIHLDNRLPKEYRWSKGDLCPRHLSIPPYPFKYEKYSRLKDGTELFIRPIRGEDEPLLRTFFENLSAESAYYRFGQHRINMPHVNLARFCQVDYDRDLAFLAAQPAEKDVIIGDVRLNRFADPDSAELSFVVVDEWQGRGIGSTLMDYCLAVSREIGIKTLWMEIMKDNSRMIKFGQKYHFKRLPGDEGDDMVEMVLELR